MNNVFYIEGSDEFYFREFWESNRQALKKENAVLMSREEANQLGIDVLFKKKDEDNKPILNNGYLFFAIPYELDDDVYFQGRKIIDSVIDLINENLSGDIFFASVDNDKCFAIKMPVINESIIWDCSSGHLNTPFVVFDSKKEFFTLLDYDLPIQIVGYKKGFFPNDVLSDWKDFFRNEWPSVINKYSNYQSLQNIIKQYYPFIELPE